MILVDGIRPPFTSPTELPTFLFETQHCDHLFFHSQMLSRVMNIHLGLKNPMRSVYFICALSFVFF